MTILTPNLGKCVTSGHRLQGFRVFLAECPVGGPVVISGDVAIRARSVAAVQSQSKNK